MHIGYDPAISSYAKEIAEFFSDAIYTPTGIRFEVVESAKVKLGIQLSGSADDKYQINMDSDLIQISANTQELLFDAMQTILQILPPQIYSNKTITDPSISWQAPCVTIEDYPRFQWRGIATFSMLLLSIIDYISSLTYFIFTSPKIKVGG